MSRSRDLLVTEVPHLRRSARVVHRLDITTANTHDSQVWDALLHGGETSVWADKGYVSTTREAIISGPGKFWGVDKPDAYPKGYHVVSDCGPISELRLPAEVT
jgi:hypothetical protein